MKKIVVIALGLALSTAVFAADDKQAEGRKDNGNKVNCADIKQAVDAANKQVQQKAAAGTINNSDTKAD